MSTQNELEEAIVAIEAQRGVLFENEVVDVALLALQEKLATVQAPPTMQQHENICVLVADMSGFTSMSEFLDAEEVRDAINAVWRKLDRVIVNWGGVIDKHLGDGVIALFGMPPAEAEESRQAMLAALDMQWELALFNEQQARLTSGTGPFRSERRIQMRVGLHTGPVYFGQVGSTDEVTAVGDTVTIAHKLEQAAPVGGVLISSELYERIHPFFEADEQPPIFLSKNDPAYTTYVVRRELPQTTFAMSSEATSTETRFVGRGDELNTLQQALQVAIDNSLAQIITIAGEAGVGKSRLLYEFERLISLLPESICVMKGVGNVGISEKPYGLIRSLLCHKYDIHLQHSPVVAREKLVRGLLNELDHDHDKAKAAAEHITQLLGFDSEEAMPQRATTKPLTLYWEASLDQRRDQRDIRSNGFEDLVYLFSAITQNYAATVIFLEDFHAADEGSYDFLDYLMQICRDLPLLIVCLTRPSLFDKRPSWRMVETTERHEMQLPPLSLIDTRHLLTELLQKLDAQPMRLMDVIGSVATGNPFELEEMVKLFTSVGILEENESRWQANMGRLLELPSPPTAPNLWRWQLEKLPETQRQILQWAAVFGPTFWDAGLLELVADDLLIGAVNLENDLQALMQTNWIRRAVSTAVPNTHQYIFRHDRLQRAIYATIPAQTAAAYHTQAAAWLASQSLPTTTRLLRLIAHQLHQADDASRAADWYGRAATQARIDLALETATFYYRRALELLPETSTHQTARIKLLEGEAVVLRKQSRFDEAVSAYQAMQQAATQDGALDQMAVARAYSGEFLCHFLTDELRHALESVRPIETIAQTTQDVTFATIAQTARGWIALAAGQSKVAAEMAREVYAHSRSLEPSPGRAFSRAFVGDLAREMGRYDQATEMTELARDMFASFGETMWETLMNTQLAQIAAEQWDLPTAVAHYNQALEVAQNAGDRFGAILSLHGLGRLYYLQGAYLRAEHTYQQALTLAERSQNQIYLAYLANDLGQLHLIQAFSATPSTQDIAQQEDHINQATRWFERARRLARKTEKPLIRVASLVGIAQLDLEDHALAEAQEKAREAVTLAERTLQQRPIKRVKLETAVAWRILGSVLAKIPQKNQQAIVSNKPVDALACFSRSHQLLEETGVSGELEKALTLRAWALLEMRRDHMTEAAPLAQEARALLVKLGRHHEADRIQELMSGD
ncbi:MAG TPA: adenylate/guanylate cyclase domain-containing protein [Chloroflexota bacterium]|nr:adenylate/guanylate cyclase domain-containing protein [Chloroflexota bacterium]